MNLAVYHSLVPVNEKYVVSSFKKFDRKEQISLIMNVNSISKSIEEFENRFKDSVKLTGEIMDEVSKYFVGDREIILFLLLTNECKTPININTGEVYRNEKDRINSRILIELNQV